MTPIEKAQAALKKTRESAADKIDRQVNAILANRETNEELRRKLDYVVKELRKESRTEDWPALTKRRTELLHEAGRKRL